MTTRIERTKLWCWWQTAAILVALVVLRALCGCAPAMDRSIEDPAARVSSYLDALTAERHEVGLQYLVVSNAGVVFEYAGGVADAKTAERVRPETTFLTSSTTKVLTAATVLRLSERGKLGLDDPLSDYLPDQPYGPRVTIRHLLNQSSGIPNPMPVGWVHTRDAHARFDEAGALAAVLADNPELEFEPGERYAYSNLSYWLLSRVIEKVAGARYCDALRREVLEPLDIKRAELDCDVAVWSRHARGHQRRWSLLGLALPLMTDDSVWDDDAEGWARFQHLYMNGPAYGGVVGTARGYAKLLQDLLRPESRLLGERERELFFSEQRNASGETLPTTLGWHRGTVGGVAYYSKPGGGPGFSSNVRVYRDRRLATVFLSNRMRVSESEIQDFSDELDAEFLEMGSSTR